MAVLQATNLKKSFGSGPKKVDAVNDVSLTLETGEILAFLGPNGAGKTTTIKMVAGLALPDAGSVRVNGLDPHQDPRTHRDIGAVLEGSRNLYMPLTAVENLEYFGVLKGLKTREAAARADELLAVLGLTEKRNTRVNDLSRGMQQKLAIGVSLVHKPRLLLLDEPTLGLDVEAAETVKELLRSLANQGHAILLTTHQLDVAQQISDRVAIIRGGKLIAEEATGTLLKQFSGKAYTIRLEGIPSAEQLAHLKARGVVVQDGALYFDGEPSQLYDVLAQVQPLTITSVERGQADLATVFLKLIKEEV